MTISFIICTYNREKYIYKCLSQLAANKTNTSWELLLIDNNSTDGTANECRRFEQDYKPKNYRYIVEYQQGLSYARNRGIEEAKGDWLVFLDDDAFVADNYITTLQNYIDTLPDMQAFGGRIVPLYESGKAPAWLCRWNRTWLSAIDKGNKVVEFEGQEFPIGANMGIRAELAKKIGLFNTNLGRTGKNLLGGEEKDYFNRIKATNATIYYLPNITVEHCIPESRTTWDYIRRLGQGVGYSERTRTLNISKIAYAKRLLAEGVKWIATLCLALYYIIICRPACSHSLVLFRWQVTKCLI